MFNVNAFHKTGCSKSELLPILHCLLSKTAYIAPEFPGLQSCPLGLSGQSDVNNPATNITIYNRITSYSKRMPKWLLISFFDIPDKGP